MQSTIVSNFSKGAYFYCIPQSSPETTPYHHTLIALAEGFKALGIPVYSNINSWRLSLDGEKYLFTYNPDVLPDDCDIVILDQNWLMHGHQTMPRSLFKPRRKYITVYMDGQDGAVTHSWQPEFRQFDFIFKNHCIKGFRYPSNFYPWVFGLSDRMLDAVNVIPEFHGRKYHFHINFRETKSHRHSVRKYMFAKICPEIAKIMPIDTMPNSGNAPTPGSYDYLYWAQTGRRHSPQYYEALKNSLACACFGGFFVLPWPKDHTSRFSRLSKRILSHFNIATNSIVQWDSWRLWEAMAAGSVVVHGDFDKYGFQSLVQPENWTHYIGINFRNIKATTERIMDEPEALEQISAKGRAWVMEHFSPLPTALRFLSTISS